MKNLRYILFGSISIGVLLLFSFGYNTDNPIQVNSNNEYEKSLVIFFTIVVFCLGTYLLITSNQQAISKKKFKCLA